MRNILIIIISTATFFLLTSQIGISISDDLSGTEWKCDKGLDEGMEYASLKFTSATAVEGWSKYIDEEESMDWSGTYLLNTDSVTISFQDLSLSGIIQKDNLDLTIENDVYSFIKQKD